MKPIAKFVFTVLLAGLMAACMFRTPDKKEANNSWLKDEEMIKRGQHLVTVSACHDCHSPKIMTPLGPEPDPERLLSGHPQGEPLPPIPKGNENWILFNMGLTGFVGPWGISYAANLTPDDTGTGSWSFDQFKLAIRKGKYKGLEGSRDLLPPMPWQMYQHFSDDELKAIFAYLQSIKPVRNLVPAPVSPADMPLN
jgi:mono/diheme cytochrome c family protein